MTNDQTSQGRLLRHAPEIAITTLILALILLCALTFRSYGFTLDEPFGYVRANNINNYFTKGTVAPLVEVRPENFYGAIADVIALWLQKLVPSLGLDARHLVSGLFGIAGIFYTYRMGAHLANRWTGVAAAGFLTLMPLWFGYMFFNLKDIPFGTALMAASYYGLKVMGDAKRPGWTTMLALAIWCGAIGTLKLTGILLLGFAVLVLLFFWMLQHGWLSLKTLAQRALLSAGLGLAGIIVFSIAFWPQLYLFPPALVIDAIRSFLNYDGWRNTVQINGQLFPWDQVPRHYLITYLIITTPLLVMALYLASFPSGIVRKNYALLGASLLPVLFVGIQWIAEAQVYNGYRHFLFTLPFFCIGAGYALVTLADIGGSIVARIGAIAVFVAFALWQTVTMVSLFPYQYSAYNLLVGGASGAQGRYYIDVWRSAEREALGVLDQKLAADGVKSARVYACGAHMNFASFPRFKLVQNPNQEPVDYLIWMPRCSPDRPNLETIAEVRRGDVLFALVLRALPDVPS